MENILLIEDEAVLLGLIATSLRLDGHAATALYGPARALDTRAAGRSPIDLLTEISTRPISGFELVARLRKKGFNGNVLFMSRGPALAHTVGESLGQRTVLKKPFTAPQLRGAVRRALARDKPKSALRSLKADRSDREKIPLLLGRRPWFLPLGALQMFFRRIRSKISSAIRRTGKRAQSDGPGRQSAAPRPERETCETYTMGASIEEILRAEYDAVRAEFYRAKDDPDRRFDINAVRQYIGAMERLRNFLSYGEIPPDVMEKLDQKRSA
jgi:CheY-like chemotaxis protein